MNKYSTIIWDMDGTLIDTLDDLTDSVNAALKEFQLPARTRIEIRSFIGNGVLRLLELSVPGGKEHPQFDAIFTFFNNHYAMNCRNKTKPYERLAELLRELKSQGYRLAIVSNKIDNALKELAELHFKDTMEVVIGDSEGIRRKPYPDKVFAALQQMNVNRESAVYIGDTEVDIETAKNAGVDYICVSWGFRDKQELQAAGATIIVDAPEELARFFA